MTTLIVAVDPGTHFAGVSVWDAGKPEPEALLKWEALAFEDMPSPARVYKAYEAILTVAMVAAVSKLPGPRHFVVEHLKGRGVQPAPELDVLCRGIQQWAAAYQWNYEEVTPRQWHQSVRLHGAPEPDKDAVVWALKARFPQLSGVAAQPGGVDAMEAVGIGLWSYSRLRLTVTAGGKR